MAVFEDLFEGWIGTGLAGLGLVLVAPIVVPVAGAVVRPVVKGLIGGALTLTATAREWVAEMGEQLGDLYAETQAEYTSGRSAEPAASRLVTPAGQPTGGA
jgi:hypothetical protein